MTRAGQILEFKKARGMGQSLKELADRFIMGMQSLIVKYRVGREAWLYDMEWKDRAARSVPYPSMQSRPEPTEAEPRPALNTYKIFAYVNRITGEIHPPLPGFGMRDQNHTVGNLRDEKNWGKAQTKLLPFIVKWD